MKVPKKWGDVPMLVDTSFIMELFNVSKPTVISWMKSGKLPAVRIGNTTRFRKQDLEIIMYGG